MKKEDILRQAPYFDDYDKDKQYNQILANPGRVIQAREFTQAQTIIFDFLKQMSDALLKDGNVLSGMSFNISEDNVCTVEDGKVYIDGKVHRFKEQSIQLKGIGRETVGVRLEYEVVTEEEDTTLRDPAQNMANFGQPGAHRLKAVPVLTLDDEESASLYEFEDGQLVVETAKPELDGISNILARRTYDESGNYRVNGLDLFVEPYDADYVQLTVEVGKAYIKGYEIMKSVPVKRLIPISKDTRTVNNEPKVYQDGIDQYALNNFPAKQINKVVAMVEETRNITRGGITGGTDFLPLFPVVSIQEVRQGDIVYEQGKDYQLTQDGVDWSLGGIEPSPGATYQVTWRYNKEMIQDTDYKLEQITGPWGDTKDYLLFLNGDRPVHNSQVTINYDYYLARADHISIDKNGEIIITQGQPDNPQNATVPTVDNTELLPLGYVILPPNSGNAKARNKTVTRLEMSTLQRMMERLEDVEYNQAVTLLDQEAIAGEPPSELLGIFSDGFYTVDRGDLTHPDFTAMYSLEDGMIMIPLIDSKVHKPVLNPADSDAEIWGRVISAPMHEVVAAEQKYATTTMKINPYQAFNTLGVLNLDPAVDNWIDEEFIEVQETKFESRKFYRWYSGVHIHDAWRYDVNADLMDLTIVEGQSGVGKKLEDWRPPNSPTHQATVMKTEKSRSVLEEAITHMRQIDVDIKASNLSPSADNFELYFDGIRVPMTPKPGFQAGSNPGTVRSNSSGNLEATFTIPAGVRTGTREVVLRNNDNTASASFTSIGTKRTVTDTVLTTRITLTPVDPLAQTFQFERPTILSSVGLYFAHKDSHNIIVQIRNVQNGYPSNVVYGEKVLSPSDVKVSNNATAETKVTFDDPIMCEANTQYCVVVLTDSPDASMYVADLGGNDLTTGVTLTRQPYLPGMLFSSSNAIAWTAHQSMNMKFKLYRAEFEETGTILFDPMYNLESDRVLLLTDFLTPENTGCIWEMNLDDLGFQPIASYIDVELDSVVNKIQLRATFKADKNMSPLIAKDSFTFVGFLQDTSGTYIGRNLEVLEPYTKVRQIFDAFVPQGSSVSPKFSYDDGETWITPNLVDQIQVDAEWYRYFYEAEVPISRNAKDFRARLDLTAQSPVVRPKARRFMNIVK